jgi:DNA-directed RNA polymerase specialized sigma24 family protein
VHAEYLQAHVEATATRRSGISRGEKMAERAHIRVHEEKTTQYASREDFRRVFSVDTDSLYQLSLLLTRDSVKAEHCFVGGLEDCVAGNSVFREWARSWAKRAIIQNAIRELKPRASQSNSPLPRTLVPDIDELSTRPGGYFEMHAVLRLEDFERFVFVMSALEHYSEHDCALLLGCPVSKVREARTRALTEMMGSSNTALSQELFMHGTK